MEQNCYRYTLEAGSKKHYCPSCNKKSFVQYLDTTTQKYLPELYGRCDREINCSYELNPYKNGYSKMIWQQEQEQNSNYHQPIYKPLKTSPPKSLPTYYIPNKALEQTLDLQAYEHNTFIQNLATTIPFPFLATDLEQVISLYYLGTIAKGYRKGAITFPFIDQQNRIRAVQVKEFDQQNHTIGTGFLHSMLDYQYQQEKKTVPTWLSLYQQNKTKVSCLFGEHLLEKFPSNPIALVEAPKTAIYGALYFGFPQQPNNFLWLAVYNLSSLTLNKCKVLENRAVYLFPDLSKEGKAFELWSTKAIELQQQIRGSNFVVSDFLERNAPTTERLQGYDLADYLIKQDWRNFRPVVQDLSSPITKIHREKSAKSDLLETTFLTPVLPSVAPKEPLWNIEALEQFFARVELPCPPILLSFGRITAVDTFVDSHLNFVRANRDKRTFLPYWERLQELRDFLIA